MNIGIIPARGGSKGIPRKNIKNIAGFPLIYWSIEAAKSSKYLDDFYVSTDNQDIAKIAKSYGAKVLIRPNDLAKDDTTTLAVLKDILTKIDCDNIVVLQPTSPLRDHDTIDLCIDEFKNGGYDTLATGYYTKIIEYGSHQNLRRQDIKGFFYDDGNIYIIKSQLINKNKWFGNNICKKVIKKELNYEIDDHVEFSIVEGLLWNRIERGVQVSSMYQLLSNIKLFAMDVDGVLTDAGMYYSEDGNELKKFNTRDGKGIELLRKTGIKTAIITSENTKIVEKRAKKLKVDYLFQGIKTNKEVMIKKVAKELGISLKNVAYIGDDVNDLTALKSVGFPITVKNATTQNKEISKLIVPFNGGDGCVRYVCDLILKNQKNEL
jgi:YrbI family 3-deoxy-D-manno-octulosonate 8-phosphate phosphatase